MGTNLDEIVQQQQVKIHDLEKELEKALTEAPTPEAVYSLTAEKPVLNKFGTTWKPTFRSRQGEAFNRYMHRIDSAMAAFFEDKWQPANGGDSQTYASSASTTQTATATEQAPASAGSDMYIMHIDQLKITADRGGFPILEFYQTGHKWPDLRYQLGKTMDERKANCAKMLANVKGPGAIVIGFEMDTNWDVVWKPGRDPKYKDVVSVGPHINGKAA